MEQPSIKVSVWPLEGKGKLLANARVIIGDAISVYPIRVIDGKSGYFLGMPQVPDRDGERRDVFFPINQEARKILTDAVVKTYRRDRPMYREYPSPEPFHYEITVRPFRDSIHDLMGYASIVINGMFRIENVRLYQGENGKHMVLFPEQGYRDEGEFVWKDIFEFKHDWEQKLKDGIREGYDTICAKAKQERIRIARGEIEGKLSYDELMELRLQRESERRRAARETELTEVMAHEEPIEEEVAVIQ